MSLAVVARTEPTPEALGGAVLSPDHINLGMDLDSFVWQLIEALGLDWEEMEADPQPLGEALLEAVRALRRHAGQQNLELEAP